MSVSNRTRRDQHESRSGRVSGLVIGVMSLLAVVAIVNLGISVLQIGGIGNLNTRLSAVETLAASEPLASGNGTVGDRTDRSASIRSDSHALSRMQAWTVSVFPLPQRNISLDSVARNTVAAGTFVHSGSWISMNEHDKHDGVLVPGSVALKIKGMFMPDSTNRYVFRLDLKYAGALKIDHKSVVFACYGRFGTGRSTDILSGKIMFHSLQNQSRHRTLMAKKPVQMNDGAPYQLTTTVYCNLPADVRASDVMFRLSVRRADEAVFTSVRSILWPTDQSAAVLPEIEVPEIQKVPPTERSASRPINSKDI